MAGKRTATDDLDQPVTRGKLVRLLQTESELDEMLRETRREAERIVPAARTDGEERIRRCEKELEDIEREVRQRVERERDETVARIRLEAEQQQRALNELDEEATAELAGYVIERLLGGSPGGEP